MVPRRNRFLCVRVAALFLGGMLAIMTSVPVQLQVEEIPRDLEGQPIRNDLESLGEAAIPQTAGAYRDAKDKPSVVVNNKKEETKPKSKTNTNNIGGVVNPHPFKYTIEPRDICTDTGPLVVAYVHSAPAKVVRRAMVRKTWANTTHHPDKKNSLRVIFAMGAAPKYQESISSEDKLYGDILQEDFMDDYKNLSHKAVGSLRWITTHCKATKFVVKTDDDAFVNVFSLLRHLGDLDQAGLTSAIFMCRLLGRMPVLRQGKWGIPREMYPDTHYPPYCSGLAFIITMDVAKALHDASYKTPYFWVDDAWLTGMVAATAKLNHTQIGVTYDLNKDNIEKKFLGDNWYQYLFGHLGPKAYEGFWNRLVKLASETKVPTSHKIIPGQIVYVPKDEDLT